MSDQFGQDDYRYMGLAIQLAERGRNTTDPNPRVGCVLVKNNEIIGQGWHEQAGLPHAERNALADVEGSAVGATAYVTLEPCCHYGRTAPCTEGLIEAGIKRVVVAMTDPNPLVAGKGLDLLEQAGMGVSVGIMQAQAELLNQGFIRRMAEQKPYVRCKLGMSLDGRTAMANGQSQWITGPQARADVQRLRAKSSAIVTGIETVLADDPSMNVRLDAGSIRQPLRVVLDSELRFPVSAKMLTLPGSTLIVHGEQVAQDKKQQLEKAGAMLLALESDEQGLALSPLLSTLATKYDVNEVLIEAGPTLAGAALQAGVVDELVVYMAAALMGHEARQMVSLKGLTNIDDKLDLNLGDVRRIGADLRLTYTLN